MIYDQKLYREATRKVEEAPVIANSTVKEFENRTTKMNYESAEKAMILNRLKVQSKTAVKYFGRYTKKDFNFGRIEMPKVENTKESGIDLSSAKQSASKSIFN